MAQTDSSTVFAFPKWIPEPLREAFTPALAQFAEAPANGALARLVADEELRGVWRTLLSRKRDRYCYNGRRYNGRRVWLGGDTQAERIVTFALLALWIPALQQQTVKQRTEEVGGLRNDVDCLRAMAARRPMLGNALRECAVNLESYAEIVEGLPAYPRDRTDPTVRFGAVMLCAESWALFGSHLYGCVAKLLNAVYGRNICNARNVRPWWEEAERRGVGI